MAKRKAKKAKKETSGKLKPGKNSLVYQSVEEAKEKCAIPTYGFKIIWIVEIPFMYDEKGFMQPMLKTKLTKEGR